MVLSISTNISLILSRKLLIMCREFDFIVVFYKIVALFGEWISLIVLIALELSQSIVLYLTK